MANAPAEDLCQFIDRSPSPFHVCATVATELEAAGFARLEERAAWPTDQGRYYLIRGGSLIAWSTEASTPPTDAFRIVGGHTDSPNLRLKQHHDLHQLGLAVVALEPYGGAWLNSWLDRDLGISGRLGLRDGTEKLVHIDEPVLRVPQLAIHLSEDRKGVQLDPQRHVNAIWGSGHGTDFLTWIGAQAGVAREDILGFELMTHDTAPSALIGANSELVSASRGYADPPIRHPGSIDSATEPNESLISPQQHGGRMSTTARASSSATPTSQVPASPTRSFSAG